jgi:hypothetical protein
MPFGPPAGGGFGAPGAMPFGPPPGGGFGAPGAMPFGPPAGGGFGAPGAMPFGPPPGGGFGAPGAATAGGPPMPMGPPPMEMPRFPSRTWADRLLGTYSRFFNLEHLWFLWYLLVFVTLAPLVARVVAVMAVRPIPDVVDRVGVALIRWNLMAVVLGLVSLPALVHARGFMGWSLANPIGFLAPFPDFLYEYHADVPYYFLCFLAGWWFFRLRDHLSDFGRTWLWSLVLGVAGFAVSQALSDRYFFQATSPHHDWIRLVGFAFYGTGAAYTTCAFLGFFQRYLDRPSPLGRYFVDTALWIYLVHLPLIPYLISWVQPSRTAWWGASLAGMVLVTGVALVLFELLVRPTPLMYVFGPPVPRRAAPADVPQAATLPASSAHIS